MIEKVMKVGDLYELYGTLLTERGQQMIEMYYFDDWSLAEIADTLGVSRQAVHDHLRRAEEQLNGYESKLKLYEQSQAQAKALEHLSEVWADCRDELPPAVRTALEEAIEAVKRLI